LSNRFGTRSVAKEQPNTKAEAGGDEGEANGDGNGGGSRRI